MRFGRQTGTRCTAFVFVAGVGPLCSAAAANVCDLPICVVEPERVVRLGCITVECVDDEAGTTLRTPGRHAIEVGSGGSIDPPNAFSSASAQG